MDDAANCAYYALVRPLLCLAVAHRISAEYEAARQQYLRTFRSALDRQVAEDVAQLLQHGSRYRNWDELALIFLTVGATWKPQNAATTVLGELTLERLLNASQHGETNAVAQSALLWTLVRDDVHQEAIPALRQALMNRIRTQVRSITLIRSPCSF